MLLTEQEDRDSLAALNLQAGQEARAAAAFDPAFHYLRSGLALLSEDSWTRQYALALALHVAAAEAGFVGGHLDEVETLARNVVEHAGSVLEKVPGYDLLLQVMVARNKPSEAVRSGLEILGLLGVHLPAQPQTSQIIKALLATRLALAGKRPEDLLALPEMTDPFKLAAMRFKNTPIVCAA
jgi:predicted ATPase